MRTYLSTGLSVCRGRHHARQVFVRQILWLVSTCLLIGHIPPGFRFAPAYSAPAERRLSSQPQPTIKEKSTPSVSPKYDCSGGLQQYSETGQAYIERAIDDALDILKRCALCSRIFDSEDPNYAIELLERLRRDKVIIISAEAPTRWALSPDRKKLKVISSERLDEAAAAVIDLAGPRDGEMKRPCIYVNPTGFIVTGRPAEKFALYGLKPHVQRAVAMLHELGHVAGVIQYDGEETKEPQDNGKSAANTNCIRWNCISCKVYQPCPGAPEPLKLRRPKRRIPISILQR
jgi:hypothetical protein